MDSDNPYRPTAAPADTRSPALSVRNWNQFFRWRNFFSTVVSILGGASVWALSLTLTGEIEPWDSATGYYALAISTASAIGGLFAGWRIWFPILGTYLGQVIYCMLFYHPGGPIIMPIAISAAIFGILPSVVGAVIGAIPHELCRAIISTPINNRGITNKDLTSRGTSRRSSHLFKKPGLALWRASIG